MIIIHGFVEDGWTLEDMDWDPETGIARFTYEHPVLGTEVIDRPQPTNESHVGWSVRERNEKVYALTERDWIRYERGLLGYADAVEDDRY